MKFNKNVIRTYGVVTVMLFLLLVIVSYQTNTVPFATLVAVPVAIAFNFCITHLYFKSRFKFPFSAIITAMIITLVIPQSTYLPIVISAVIVAELSKSLIKLKSKNIFNPAAISLVIIFIVFNVNSIPFSWVNATSVYLSLPLLLLLGLSIYYVKRVPASLSFGIAFVFLSIISLGLVKGFSITWMYTLLLSGYYSIAFVMLSDPKTSPKETWVQCIYGGGTAFLTFIFSAVGLNFAFPIAILLGNLAYLKFIS